MALSPDTPGLLRLLPLGLLALFPIEALNGPVMMDVSLHVELLVGHLPAASLALHVSYLFRNV